MTTPALPHIQYRGTFALSDEGLSLTVALSESPSKITRMAVHFSWETLAGFGKELPRHVNQIIARRVTLAMSSLSDEEYQ